MRCYRLLVLAGLALLGGCGGGEEQDEVPIVPAQPAGALLACAPGELARDDGSCQRSGVPEDGCGAGFDHDGSGCVALLPASPCIAGELALAGESACRPVHGCAAGRWGDIPVDGGTVYVDASHAGTLENGSAMQPWRSLQAAIDAAPEGAIIAVAAGSYLENLVVDKPVALWGSCPGQVAIVGAAPAPTVELVVGGVSLRQLAIEGGGVGVSVRGADGVLIERVWIHDSELEGVSAVDDGSATIATIRDTLIERARGVGISGWGADVTVEDTVVRHMRPYAGGLFGRGISLSHNPHNQLGGNVVVKRSIIDDTVEVGMAFYGCDALVEDTLVRATAPNETEQLFGSGIEAPRHDTSGLPTHLRLRRSVIEQSHFCGLCTYDSWLEMEATTLRDTRPEVATGGSGYGVRILAYDPAAARPFASILRSTIERSHLMGLAVVGADADVESLLVRETAASEADGKFGRGIGVEPSSGTFQPGSIVLRGARIEQSHEVGLLVLGSQGELDSVLVREVSPRPVDGAYGAGIVFHLEPLTGHRSGGTLRRSVVEDTHAAGVAALGADLIVSDVIAADTKPQASANDFGDGIVASAWVQFLDQLYPTSIEIERASVTGNARAGIASFGAEVGVGSSLVDCNTIALDAETLDDMRATFEDRGRNVCGCGSVTVACKVLSSNLEPPPSLPP